MLEQLGEGSLIGGYVKEGDAVLDFACGKGGDLTKYRKARVGSYVGVDIALESVRRDATQRYNGGSYPFPATFIAGDCFEVDLCDQGAREGLRRHLVPVRDSLLVEHRATGSMRVS